jgi:DNA-directed RNA polymerase subunit RPC12/RpoP
MSGWTSKSRINGATLKTQQNKGKSMIKPDQNITCPTCAQLFMVPVELVELRQEQKGSLTCPACSGKVFWPTVGSKIVNLESRLEKKRGTSTRYWGFIKTGERKIASLRGHVKRQRRIIDEFRAKVGK